MKTPFRREVLIRTDSVELPGTLDAPEGAESIVIFAHGSGSGRLSPRNQAVARTLRDHGLATLLFDLLDNQEAEDRVKVFDIDLLASRLLVATDFVLSDPDTSDFVVGYFGASTGAAAALQAAALRPDQVKAVVSRGGRPDLARDYLPRVTAATLLIIGGEDFSVIPLNEEAYLLLGSTKKMAIVPGATHLFEEPGALEQVANLAQEWFRQKLIRTEDS